MLTKMRELGLDPSCGNGYYREKDFIFNVLRDNETQLMKKNYSSYSKSNLGGAASQANLDKTTALHSETSPNRSNSNM